jgi:hypothetical protein
MPQNFRKKLYPGYKKKKKRIHPDDKPPEERYKNIRDAEQAVQDADMEEGNYLQDPEQSWNPIQIIEESLRNEGENYDNLRGNFINTTAGFAQKIDDKLTDITGQNWIGDRTRNVVNLGADLLYPEKEEAATIAATIPIASGTPSIYTKPLPLAVYGLGIKSKLNKKR